MSVQELRKGIHYVGAVDWDRRLFDELIPLPDGTSYNSYLVQGSEKTALIDTVDPTKCEELMSNLEKLGVETIDYVVSHHGEQEHSGSIPMVLERYPDAKVVTNPKCKGLLMDHLLIPEEKFITVEDGETLSLGNRTFEFIYAPWVHWPETMFTYLGEDKILFTCDFLGSHLATSELYVADEAKAYQAAKRYYAEIMMPFRNKIPKHLEKIEQLEVDIIATSHGPIYDNPKFILDAYKDWVSPDVKNEVIVAFVSMHDSTRKMVEHLVEELVERDIVVKVYNLSKTDIGELAMDLVDAATIVVASPTVLTGPHPLALYAVYLTNALRPKLRFATIIGSYGWGGRMVDQIKGMLTNLKVELIEPVIIKGYPKDEDFKSLTKLADEILEKHKGLDVMK
ncbi:MAG: FprA family A-type flavoprotein [Methanobacteriota archaeon]|nr:MAG: FprA family A-type flavoprotein [Euryarchaeota archaeon]